MDEVGPGGTFLTHNHTAKIFKKTFWIPRVFDRNVFEIWKDAGSKDIRALLNEEAKEIFKDLTPDELPSDVIISIEKILAQHQPDVSV